MPARIIFPEKGQVMLENFDPGRPAASELRVRTRFSLMSIGTETIILHQRYEPNTHFSRMFSFPQLKTGVQAIAEVEECGDAVEEFQPGDIIFMRRAHGSHQVLPAFECSIVPAGLDLKQACWCGLAKTAFRAAWAGRFEAGQHILIIGAGPVGQMAIRWATVADVGTLAVSDLSSHRLEHAKRGGANHLLEKDIAEAMEEVGGIDQGQGPGVVVDTTGNAAVFKHALAAAARFAKVILLGDSGYPSRQCLNSEMMTKGLTIQATHDSHDRDGWTQRKVDAHFFELVARGRFNLDGLITHEYTPEQCCEAYEQAEQRREQSMGILFDWGRRTY